jgi:uncharacterized protein YegL
MSADRRLPVYFLIDTSGSMTGEPIQAVNVGMAELIESLRQDPHALETLWLSIITYDSEVKVLLPLTALEDIAPIDIQCPLSGPTHMGEALLVLNQNVPKEVRTSGDHRDWRPLLFMMTDGKPSDLQLFNEQISITRSMPWAKIVGCAAGPKANPNELKKLCDPVVTLETMDGQTLVNFFQWVSASVAASNVSMGATNEMELPPPPEEVNIVI